jgi:uncharacterized protein with FMN-binding domain
MRRVIFALISTAVGVFLLLSYKSHSPAPSVSALAVVTPGPTEPSGSSGSSGATGPTASTGSPGTSAGTGSGSSSGVKNGTFTGSAVNTPFGAIQVQASIVNGKLTNVAVLQETDGARSQQIDSYAFPILKNEALTADSASIDAVSGATYTSQGYAQSLQSALDQAGQRS